MNNPRMFLYMLSLSGGNRISIADLLFACTLQQTAAAGDHGGQ